MNETITRPTAWWESLCQELEETLQAAGVYDATIRFSAGCLEILRAKDPQGREMA
jgi:hypothetical protein